MNHYESIFIARPSLTDEEVSRVMEKIKSSIDKSGGTVLKAENWGKKKLAYEVSKEKKGTYVFFYFQSDGKVVDELERTYRLDDAVMKFITVKLTKKDLALREFVAKREIREASLKEKQVAVSEEVKEEKTA